MAMQTGAGGARGERPIDWTLLKFLAFPLLSLVVLVEVALGGDFLWLVFPSYLLIAFAGDEVLGDDFAMGSRARARVLDAYLYSALPLALGVTALFAIHAGGAPAWVSNAFAAVGVDIDARVALTDGWDLAAGAFGIGTFYGTLVNVAHELIHRTGDRPAWLTGRWLLAHTLDTGFAIEHVHGHHRHIGTDRDPASARRGEYVLAFAWRSTVGQARGAFEHEAERLTRRGLPVWSRHNVFLRGQAMSTALIVAVGLLGGWAAIAAFLVTAVLGKLYLELINYVEHYGLARIEGTRVRPHHSWNCHNRMSSWVLFNLPRHSDHHMFAGRPYYDLRPVPDLAGDAPVLPMGYLGSIMVALVPRWWNRMMEPRLADWDARLASVDEVEAAKRRAVR